MNPLKSSWKYADELMAEEDFGSLNDPPDPLDLSNLRDAAEKLRDAVDYDDARDNELPIDTAMAFEDFLEELDCLF